MTLFLLLTTVAKKSDARRLATAALQHRAMALSATLETAPVEPSGTRVTLTMSAAHGPPNTRNDP